MDTDRIRDELYHRLSRFAYNDKHIIEFNLRFEDGNQPELGNHWRKPILA